MAEQPARRPTSADEETEAWVKETGTEAEENAAVADRMRKLLQLPTQIMRRAERVRDSRTASGALRSRPAEHDMIFYQCAACLGWMDSV